METKKTYEDSGREETMFVDDFEMFSKHMKEKPKEEQETATEEK